MVTTVSHDGHAIQQDITENPTPQFKIRSVSSEAPVRWLKQGIADFKKIPSTSITLGMVYVVLGAFLIGMAWGYPIFITTLAAAFLMIGPIVAVGFYCMSCQIEHGEQPNIRKGLASMNNNSVSLIYFALVLGILMGIWALLSTITVALFFNNITIVGNTLETLMAQPNFLPFLGVYVVTAALVSAVAFAISVIAAPLITNKKVDFVTAMITSVRAVQQNPTALFSWAFMIAAMVLVGFLAGFVGLAITLPIVGHATWHAYRDLVEDDSK